MASISVMDCGVSNTTSPSTFGVGEHGFEGGRRSDRSVASPIDVDRVEKVRGRRQLRLKGLECLGSQFGELESVTDGGISGHDAGPTRVGDDGEAVAYGQRLA